MPSASSIQSGTQVWGGDLPTVEKFVRENIGHFCIAESAGGSKAMGPIVGIERTFGLKWCGPGAYDFEEAETTYLRLESIGVPLGPWLWLSIYDADDDYWEWMEHKLRQSAEYYRQLGGWDSVVERKLRYAELMRSRGRPRFIAA